jgi:colanic acid/amylovoran biosynthesis protein
MRILVEHSGYDLLNLGDVAMLQTCVRRLKRRWPHAEIQVVTHSPQALEALLPGTIPLGPDLVDRPVIRSLPGRWRLAAEQAYRTAAPLLPMRQDASRTRPRGRSLRAALQSADVVVAAGGGYLCDPIWWHGLGVLATLRGAQRLGRPTAMFGQGIGPLTVGPFARLATTVLDRLDVLTLREAPSGLQFLEDRGLLPTGRRAVDVQDLRAPLSMTRGGAWVAVTGDDALAGVVDVEPIGGQSPATLIGVNIRVSDYSGVRQDTLPAFRDAVTSVARDLEMDLLALPVSQYSQEADLPAVARALGPLDGRTGPRLMADPVSTPEELIRAAGRCHAVITGSYHAAVFALGQGVPVVGLSASGYYDQKFEGLRHLYPGLVAIVRLEGPDLSTELEQAIRRTVGSPVNTRARGVAQSRQLVNLAEASFAAFAEVVDRGRCGGQRE